MSIYEEIDVSTARRAESNAKDDFTWAVTMWRMTGRERDKLKERVEELEGVAEHADFFPYLREMFDRVELIPNGGVPRLRLHHVDASGPDEFEISDEFFGWLQGISESIPAAPAPSK